MWVIIAKIRIRIICFMLGMVGARDFLTLLFNVQKICADTFVNT